MKALLSESSVSISSPSAVKRTSGCPRELRGGLTESRYCRGGRIIFIEVKRPGLSDGLSIRQKKVIATLEGLGCTVWRISDMEDLKARLKADGI
jgi:hypothetical protein